MPEKGQPSIQFTDSQFVRGILANDFQVLEKIYAEHLPPILTMVKGNNGTSDDARDVFQEAIVVIFKKASDSAFELTTTFAGYLYSVCRYIWLRQLKKKHRSEVTLASDEAYIADDDMEAHLVEFEKKRLFRQKLAQLEQDCQQVLRQFFAGIALKEIAKQMGYTEDYVKKKNLKCKEKLATLVKTDRRYEELKS